MQNDYEALREEHQLLQASKLDLEREHSEVISNYERDQALWEDRCQFLENQKNQAKRDLQDAHQKFEMTVEQLQRKDSSERGIF